MLKNLKSAIFVALLLATFKLSAATIYVNPLAGGGNTGVDWPNAFTDLQSALGAATAGDNLWLASGNYLPTAGSDEAATFSLGEGVSVIGGFAGNETDESQRNWVDNPTVLSGDIGALGDETDNSDTVVTISGNHVRLDGVIIQDGHDQSTNAAGLYLYNVSGFRLENCVVRFNKAVASTGGGAYIRNKDAAIAPNVVANCVFDSNEAGLDGGGLVLDAGNSGNNPDEIYNCIFVNNTGTRGGAGLLYASSGNAYNLSFYGNIDGDGVSGGEAGQMAINAAGTSGVVKNVILQGAVSTTDISSWKNPGDSALNFEGVIVGSTNIGAIGTGDISLAVLGTNVLSAEPIQFVNPSQPAGADNIWFTSDDGLKLTAGANAIDFGSAVPPHMDKDILGMSRVGTPDLGAYEFAVGPAPSLTFTGNTQYVAPGNVMAGAMDVGWIDFNLYNAAGDNRELAALELVVQAGNAMDVTLMRLFQGGSDVNASNGGAFNINGGGNLELTFSTPLTFSAGTNLDFRLKFNFADPLSPSDNMQVLMDPMYMSSGSGNVISGTPFVSSLLNFLPAGGGSGNLQLQSTGYNFSGNLAANVPNDILEFRLDNAGSSDNQVITNITVEMPQGDAANDFADFALFDTAMGNVLIAGNALTGNVLGGNVVWNQLALGVDMGTQRTFRILASPAVSPVSDNFMMQVGAPNIGLAGGNTVDGPMVQSVLIPLSSGNGGGGSPLIFTSTMPANGDMNVPVGSNLLIGFDEPIALNSGNIEVFAEGGSIQLMNEISPNLSVSGNTLMIDLPGDLPPSANIHVLIAPNMIGSSVSGNVFGGFVSSSEWMFTTASGNGGGGSPLIFTSTMPANGDMNVPVGSNLLIGFDEPIALNSGNIEIFAEGGSIQLMNEISPNLSVSGNTLMIDLPGDLPPSANIHVLIAPNMVGSSVSGNVFGGFVSSSEWMFTTSSGNGGGGSPLIFTSTMPANGDMNVPVGSNLLIGFDEPIALNAGNIEVFAEGGSIQLLNEISPNLSVSGNTLMIDLPGDLPPSANIHVLIAPNMIGSSISGNVFGGFVSSSEWMFTTGMMSGNGGPMFSQLRIAAGHGSVYALHSNQSLHTAGRNDFGQLLRMGDPNFASQVSGPPMKALSAGVAHGLGIGQNGNLMLWGSNDFGQSHSDSGNLMEDGSLGAIVQVEAGSLSSFVITESNQLFAKGRNHRGQLGLGDTVDRSSWTEVTGLPAGNIQDVSSGIEHTLVLIDDVIYGFGSNAYGQLGTGSLGAPVLSPVMVSNTQVWADVEAGGFHSLAITASQQVFAWGKNSSAQLGLGNTNVILSPVMVAGLNNVKAISAGHSHTLFLVDDGSTRSCFAAGSNREGQCAQPLNMAMVMSPMLVDSYIDVDEISAGPYTSLLIRANQWVKIWGQMPNGSISEFLQVYLTLVDP